MKEFLRSRGIELFGAIPLSSCKITRGYLLERAGLGMDSTVVMMLLPYRSEHTPKNLSVYASAPDYHAFVSELREDIKAYLGERFEGEKFELFGDHSPIDEVNGACLAGLGFIGDNGLLINEEYSSFVFLCELITSIRPEALGLEMVRDVSIKRCIGCGACMRACPSRCMDKSDPRPKSECLSAITQKKGELTPEEIALMLDNGSIWGCDICQSVCPYTKGAKLTPIDFFKNNVITALTSELIENMSDEELSRRAFGWRGRKTLLRNIYLYEGKTPQE
ncbi:MAG: epoxyqueuosine reductase [Clostridia bacterium]|nr:epoxyqueuosine reductase [Clostridia bacterium]